VTNERLVNSDSERMCKEESAASFRSLSQYLDSLSSVLGKWLGYSHDGPPIEFPLKQEIFHVIEANKIHYFSFDIQLYMFRTALLPITRSLAETCRVVYQNKVEK